MTDQLPKEENLTEANNANASANLDAAAKMAQVNHENHLAQNAESAPAEDTSAKTELPAQPKKAESTNPEQVNVDNSAHEASAPASDTTDPADDEVKANEELPDSGTEAPADENTQTGE